jgi:glucose/arabinose dehydrogenase
MEIVMYPINGYWLKIVAIAFCCLSLTAGERAFGQVRQGEAAIGAWRDDQPGVRRLLTPQDLPAITKSTNGPAEIVAMPAGTGPQVPDGFSAELVATSGLHKPRVIRVVPNGDLFVADSMFGSVHVLRVPAGRAKPEKDAVFASGLQQPFGIAFHPLGPNPQCTGPGTATN